jgi:hypothetical protein
MGARQSSSMDTFIEMCNSITVNVLNEQMTNNSVECSAINNQNVIFGPGSSIRVLNGNINISQKNVVECSLDSVISTDNSTEIETKLKNALDNLMDQQSKTTTGFMATAFSDQEARQNFRSIVQNAVSTTIRNSTISSCAVSVTAINNSTVRIDGTIYLENGDLDISQEALVKSSAKCIVNSVINNISKSDIDSTLKNVQTQSLVAEVRGFFESLGSLGNILIIIAVLVVVALLGFGAFKLMGGKKEGQQ